jgi:hypothetical protein
MMKPSHKRLEVARALGIALEPVIDVCLDLGLTSPELESMLRGVFVQRAITKLPRHRRTGKPPSDVRVGLAVGLHRNEVRKIRSGRAEVRMEKMEGRHRAGRLLKGWSTDPRFTTSGGQPLDLPLESDEQGPSFEELVAKYLPGTASGSVLKELRRRSLVQLLPDEIIRFRSLTTRTVGLNATNVALAAKRLQLLGSTVLHNIRDAKNRRLYEEMKSIKVDSARLPLIRLVLERRARTFLEALESELRAAPSASRRADATQVGVSVFSWEQD